MEKMKVTITKKEIEIYCRVVLRHIDEQLSGLERMDFHGSMRDLTWLQWLGYLDSETVEQYRQRLVDYGHDVTDVSA